VPLYRQLYFQVVVAIFVGAVLGHFEPAFAESLKPLAMPSSSW
jgi:aerobic C4-dicarboxylate transport protein